MCTLFSSLTNLVGSFAASRTWVQILLPKKKKQNKTKRQKQKQKDLFVNFELLSCVLSWIAKWGVC